MVGEEGWRMRLKEDFMEKVGLHVRHRGRLFGETLTRLTNFAQVPQMDLPLSRLILWASICAGPRTYLCGEQQTFVLCITQQAAALRREKISVRALRPLSDGARADTSGSFLCREKMIEKPPRREHSGNDRSGVHRL